MPFVKGDPNINRQGRIEKSDKPTAKQIKQKEFLSLLRKLKPLLSKSVNAASKIIDDEDASEAGKLRAAALLIQTYKDLVKEVYEDSDTEESAAEIDTNVAPVFSMRVIDKDGNPVEN